VDADRGVGEEGGERHEAGGEGVEGGEDFGDVAFFWRKV
jgi:hypothetical protein